MTPAAPARGGRRFVMKRAVGILPSVLVQSVFLPSLSLRMDHRTDGRARSITVRRYASAADADRDDLSYWLQLSEAERIIQAWRLSQELWRLRGEYSDEPRLCRSVARVRRSAWGDLADIEGLQ
jgi:hypothetical protein